MNCKMRKELIFLLVSLGEDCLIGKISGTSIHPDKDIHAFYRLSKNPSKVIHVQAYPGMSNKSEARVFARMMDYDSMILTRKYKSVGNEHEAVIQSFPNFEDGIVIPYNPEILKNKLAENIPELR